MTLYSAPEPDLLDRLLVVGRLAIALRERDVLTHRIDRAAASVGVYLPRHDGALATVVTVTATPDADAVTWNDRREKIKGSDDYGRIARLIRDDLVTANARRGAAS